jgi:hypothetical protein
MAPQKKTFAAIRKARATPANAQKRLRTWLFANYFEESLMSTKVTRTVVLTEAEFDQVYVEPARARWALEPAPVPTPEPEPTPDSQQASSFRTGIATRASSSAADVSFSRESDYVCGTRCLRQPRSLPVLTEQPELDEGGSGYESDVSDGADSSETSSSSESDSSSILYTPDTSSSGSNHEDSSDSDQEGSSDSDQESSSDSDHESPSGSDNESSSDSDHGSYADAGSGTQSISSRVNAVTSPEHQERSDAVEEHEESNGSANESPETLPPPANNGITLLIQRFEELDRAIDNARDILRTTLGHSYGEYMASLASLEVLECEREQLSSNAFCPYCPHCQFARQRLAELDRAIDRARQSLQTTGAYSYGEYRAGFATLEALELEREQLRLGAFYWHYQ